MMQFQNQLAAVDMATPLERIGSWKISPMMTQPAGPQVLECCQLTEQDKRLRDAYLRCKEEDEQAHEDNQDVACRLRVLRYGADDGNHEFANRHADSSPNEQGATTKFLDGVERDGRRAYVDDRCDHGDQERVLQAHSLEERGVVV